MPGALPISLFHEDGITFDRDPFAGGKTVSFDLKQLSMVSMLLSTQFLNFMKEIFTKSRKFAKFAKYVLSQKFPVIWYLPLIFLDNGTKRSLVCGVDWVKRQVTGNSSILESSQETFFPSNWSTKARLSDAILPMSFQRTGNIMHLPKLWSREQTMKEYVNEIFFCMLKGCKETLVSKMTTQHWLYSTTSRAK